VGSPSLARVWMGDWQLPFCMHVGGGGAGCTPPVGHALAPVAGQERDPLLLILSTGLVFPCTFIIKYYLNSFTLIVHWSGFTPLSI
jgi:hypothetical protein